MIKSLTHDNSFIKLHTNLFGEKCICLANTLCPDNVPLLLGIILNHATAVYTHSPDEVDFERSTVVPDKASDIPCSNTVV